MVTAGKDGFPAELLNRFLDAVIVRSDHYARHASGLPCPFHHMLDHRTARNRRQRLARKAGRGVSGRNYGENLHVRTGILRGHSDRQPFLLKLSLTLCDGVRGQAEVAGRKDDARDTPSWNTHFTACFQKAW
jgi:hypothetical protein